MKRLITFLLVAFSISQLSWGQESSQNNSQSSFVGEWTGIYNYETYIFNGNFGIMYYTICFPRRI